MDKDRILVGNPQPVGHPTGNNPPSYPWVKLHHVDGNQQGAHPGANPVVGKSQDGYLPQPPNPGFKPSELNNPGVTFNPGYEAGDLGESGEMKAFDFTDRSIRKSFIRKVYSILMAQLLVTVGFMAWFLFHEPTKYWIQANAKTVYYSSLAPMLVFFLVMACSEKARRTFPMNFILLSFFTISMSVMLGVVTSLFDTDVVMLAVGITAAVCLALTLFALQTKWDFTAMGGVLCVCLTALFMFGLMSCFIRTRITIVVYASLGAILFSFYLIYDTQRMMGGNHKYAITPEEYIFAALALYLDVINLFLFILRLIRLARG